jgi:hypothetical protein
MLYWVQDISCGGTADAPPAGCPGRVVRQRWAGLRSLPPLTARTAWTWLPGPASAAKLPAAAICYPNRWTKESEMILFSGKRNDSYVLQAVDRQGIRMGLWLTCAIGRCYPDASIHPIVSGTSSWNHPDRVFRRRIPWTFCKLCQPSSTFPVPVSRLDRPRNLATITETYTHVLQPWQGRHVQLLILYLAAQLQTRLICPNKCFHRGKVHDSKYSMAWITC